MLALHPPFRAKDMNELFNRVTAGVFESLPKSYSPDLTSLISSMIRVNPKDRPTAEQLLQTPTVKLKTS
jgi:NIMA (never in mitosis gene a)-related kinase